ncbi:MAG TPA: hypothetical protein VHS33_10300 [Sphingomicrobium sp.]|nr:hypothetical protein [Sphingomicrobium sp.]
MYFHLPKPLRWRKFAEEVTDAGVGFPPVADISSGPVRRRHLNG